MICDIFKKLGATCKAGTKTALCPQKKAKKGKTKTGRGFDSKTLISIDQPFDYEEVAAITGPEYIGNLVHESTVIRPYAELKKEMASRLREPAVKQAPVRASMPATAAQDILVIDDEAAVNNNNASGCKLASA